jgi:hypothetical protein
LTAKIDSLFFNQIVRLVLMQTTLWAAGFTSDDDAPLLAQLPKWVQREACEIAHYPGKRPCINLSFECPFCDVVDRVKANQPKAGWSKGQAAQMLADAVVNKHSSCQPACGESCVPSNQQRLESRLAQTKRKLCIAQSTAQTATAKAAQNEAAAKTAKYQKQKHTTGDQRRVEIDRSNETLLSDSDKSCAKTTPRTGLIDTILYWARGSVGAVVQLIMVLIREYHLEDRVVAELRPDLATNADHETNHYVVYRLRLALDILKKPGATEQQRKEYEIILAAAAPELRGDKLTDPRGMATKVAAVLNVSRRVGGPFSKSIDRRQEIDKLAKLCDEPIEVGDAVACRHGTGALSQLDGDSCCIEIIQEGQKFESKFKSAGRGKGGARLRRPALTFSPPDRKRRKDATSLDMKQKVRSSSDCAPLLI